MASPRERPKRYWSVWRFKGSHLCDVWSSLVENSTWRKHPAPFAKTRAGELRRATRLFVVSDKRGFAR